MLFFCFTPTYITEHADISFCILYLFHFNGFQILWIWFKKTSGSIKCWDEHLDFGKMKCWDEHLDFGKMKCWDEHLDFGKMKCWDEYLDFGKMKCWDEYLDFGKMKCWDEHLDFGKMKSWNIRENEREIRNQGCGARVYCSFCTGVLISH